MSGPAVFWRTPLTALLVWAPRSKHAWRELNSLQPWQPWDTLSPPSAKLRPQEMACSGSGLRFTPRKHSGCSLGPRLRVAPPAAQVTRREREVLGHLAEGLSNRQIAERLVVSEHTVHRHVTNILRKLALPSRSAAAAYAVRSGLLGDRLP